MSGIISDIQLLDNHLKSIDWDTPNASIFVMGWIAGCTWYEEINHRHIPTLSIKIPEEYGKTWFVNEILSSIPMNFEVANSGTKHLNLRKKIQLSKPMMCADDPRGVPVIWNDFDRTQKSTQEKWLSQARHPTFFAHGNTASPFCFLVESDIMSSNPLSYNLNKRMAKFEIKNPININFSNLLKLTDNKELFFEFIGNRKKSIKETCQKIKDNIKIKTRMETEYVYPFLLANGFEIINNRPPNAQEIQSLVELPEWQIKHDDLARMGKEHEEHVKNFNRSRI